MHLHCTPPLHTKYMYKPFMPYVLVSINAMTYIQHLIDWRVTTSLHTTSLLIDLHIWNSH